MNKPINMYAFVLECLRAQTIPQRQVAEESGVPFSTLAKLAQGSVKSPSVHTVQKLFDYFTARSPIAPAPAVAPEPIPECGAIDPRHNPDRRHPEKRQAPRRKEGA